MSQTPTALPHADPHAEPRALARGQRHARFQTFIQRYALWLRDHQRVVAIVQWSVVVCYLLLLLIPLGMPLPASQAHIWDNITLFAQFAFWGVWWPFVLLSIVLLGRTWCGLLCPEGTLTQWASKKGLGLAIPRWVRWQGWPFVAFCLTTVYGQLISVYQYPWPAALILGGSTVAAMVVGWLFGRDRRVWCRYLCPVSGVFQVLARIAPWYYRVDAQAWRQAPANTPAAHCAPLLPLRNLQSSGDCQMCGRCAGHRDAMHLTLRSANSEVLRGDGGTVWQQRLIIIGLMGVAPGAFFWSVSLELVRIKQWLAEWLIEHDIVWPLQDNAPWFVLTHYPQVNDSLHWLDGTLMLGCIGVVALICAGVVQMCLWVGARLLKQSAVVWPRLTQGYIPFAGAGVFTGLSATTRTLWHPEGNWLLGFECFRGGVLLGGWLWTVWLLYKLTQTYKTSILRRCLARLLLALAMTPALWIWVRFISIV